VIAWDLHDRIRDSVQFEILCAREKLRLGKLTISRLTFLKNRVGKTGNSKGEANE
jgi:hypothetical protein